MFILCSVVMCKCALNMDSPIFYLRASHGFFLRTIIDSINHEFYAKGYFLRHNELELINFHHILCQNASTWVLNSRLMNLSHENYLFYRTVYWWHNLTDQALLCSRTFRKNLSLLISEIISNVIQNVINKVILRNLLCSFVTHVHFISSYPTWIHKF